MSLTSTYVLATERISDILGKIRDGQAPERFSTELLKDWGFSSSNDRRFIPLLKALGFLTSDGKPTQRYHDYRDHSRSRKVLGQALRDAYADLFLIKEHPTSTDRDAIEGKFKSFHNASDNVAGLMTKTFYALLAQADLAKAGELPKDEAPKISASQVHGEEKPNFQSLDAPVGLHYNIQIHLPATKDVEVYNAIFKSLREHLISK